MNLLSIVNKFKLLTQSKISVLAFSSFSKASPNGKVKIIGSQKRTNFSFSIKKASPEKFKKEDNIPDHYNLIYRNVMDKYFLGAQIFSGIGAVVLTIGIFKADFDKPIAFSSERKFSQVKNEQLVYYTAFVMFMTMLQVMIYKNPIRIYNNPKKNSYIAIFYRSIPFQTRRLRFKVDEVTKVKNNGILPWNNSRYVVENQQYIILMENFFRRPVDLSIMLGEYKNDEAD